MRSEDQLFDKVRASLHDYAPEVPASVYSGMRRKLWWSNFMRFQAHRLNAWYVLLLIGVGAGAWCTMGTSEVATVQTPTTPTIVEESTPTAANASAISVTSVPVLSTAMEQEQRGSGSACCSAANVRTSVPATSTYVETVTASQPSIAEPQVPTEMTAQQTSTSESAPSETQAAPAVEATATPAEEKAPTAKPRKGRGMKVTVYETKN